MTLLRRLTLYAMILLTFAMIGAVIGKQLSETSGDYWTVKSFNRVDTCKVTRSSHKQWAIQVSNLREQSHGHVPVHSVDRLGGK